MCDESDVRMECVLERIKQAYDRLFEAGDTAYARSEFRAVIGDLQRIASAPSNEGEQLDALHLVADLGAELGDVELVKQAASELARVFQPEDAEELEGMVEDMVTEWWSLDAAEAMLDRLEGQTDPEVLATLRGFVDEAREAATISPLSAAQILALRSDLLSQGVLVEGEEGFDIEEEDAVDPLHRTRSWLEQHGLDVDRSLDFLRQQGQASSDAEVLLSMQPLGIYDALAHWPLEGTVRRYWMKEAEEELSELEEEWASESPDGKLLAIFDDDGETAYLYVYDKSDEELVAPPLWLYNRLPAPDTDELQPSREGSAPLMPRRFMLDSGYHEEEPEEVEILWAEDGTRVAVKADGEFLGFVNLKNGQGYSFNLKEESEVGAPWPVGMSWEESDAGRDEADEGEEGEGEAGAASEGGEDRGTGTGNPGGEGERGNGTGSRG